MAEEEGELDEIVHQRARLGILTACNEAHRVEFGFLQEALGLTAGNLSRHLRILEEAGYVTLQKGFVGRRARTWAAITRRGRRALESEVARLRVIVERFEAASEGARLEVRPATGARGRAGPVPEGA